MWALAVTTVLPVIGTAGEVSARTEQQSSAVIELDAGRAIMTRVAHNPERHEYLVVWRSRFGSEDVRAVRLDRNGAALGDPFVVVPDSSAPLNQAPNVAYNPTTNQYAVTYQRADVAFAGGTEGQSSHVYARLVSDLGVVAGPEVQISPDFSTYYFCSAINPNVAFDASTGGYLFAYYKTDFVSNDPARCPGIPVDSTYRVMLQPAASDLAPGSITMAPAYGSRPTPDEPEIEAHPVNGTFLVVEAIDELEGRAYLYGADRVLRRQTALTQPSPAGNFGLTRVTADPATGNWLLAWRQNRRAEAVTMVLDADGRVIEPSHVGLADAQLIDVVAVGDGSFVGLDTRARLVHIDGSGTAFSVEALDDFAVGNGLSFTPGSDLGLDVDSGRARVVAIGNDSTGLELAVATADVFPPGNLPLVPARLVESRSGPGFTTVDGEQQAIGKRVAGSTTTVDVGGRGGVPADAEAVVLNVTQADADAPGFFTVYPCDADRPNASSLNHVAGGAASSAVFVKLSAAGTACVYTLAGAHLIVDVNSYVPAGGSIESVVPARLLETRSGFDSVDGDFEGIGRVAAGSVTPLTVTGRGGVDDDAEAVLVNVTIVAPSAPTFVTIFPCGSERPLASNLNALAGQVVNNLALAKVGSNGRICLFSLAESDLVVDVGGFVPTDGGLRPLDPARLLETRNGPDDRTIDGASEGIGPIPTDSEVRLRVSGRGGVPAGATGAMLNVTAVTPDGPGFMTLYPCDQSRPLASNVNFGPGDVVANAVFVKLDPGGDVCVYSFSRSDVVIDVVGFTRDG